MLFKFKILNTNHKFEFNGFEFRNIMINSVSRELSGRKIPRFTKSPPCKESSLLKDYVSLYKLKPYLHHRIK